MKALTIMQPQASLVALKAKRYETRSWFTNYRGPVAIHASLGFPYSARRLVKLEPFSTALLGCTEDDLPLGCVVAIADIAAVFATVDLSGQSLFEFSEDSNIEREEFFGDFSPGRYAWLLNNVRALEYPIPVRGARGLWEWNGEELLLKQGINIYEKEQQAIQARRCAA